MVVADRVHVIDESGAGNMGAVVVSAGAGANDAHLRSGEVGLKPGGGHGRFDGSGGQKGEDRQHGTLLVYSNPPLDVLQGCLVPASDGEGGGGPFRPAPPTS